jgi:aryl-phospho-beta-D-glucosidase BglC (GH1 family)
MIAPLLTILIFSYTPTTTTTPASALAHSPAPAVASLARGVNLSHWFWVPLRGSEMFGDPGLMSDAEMADLVRAGLTCVRLPVDPERLFSESGRTLNKAALARLDAVLDRLLAAGLAVVIDIHPAGAAADRLYDRTLHNAETPAAKKAEEALLRNWTLLAEHLGKRPADKVFLELLNEPVFDRHEGRWQELQAKLATVVRGAAPNHTLILSGANWGTIEGLTAIKDPWKGLPDRNVVWSFHFYEPRTFTHQTATWGSPSWRFLQNVPYPATRETIEPLLASVADETARLELDWYGRQQWNAAKLAGRLDRAKAWADTHGATLWCGEFGAIAKAPREARLAYLADVRTALDARGIAWCMWDYAGAFALMRPTPPHPTPPPPTPTTKDSTPAAPAREIDPDVLRALIPR